MINITYKQKVS